MSDRGMKKWNAYKALVEQYEALDQTVVKNEIHERPILSSDKEEEINDILVNYHGQELIFKYFHNKKPTSVQGIIKKIDTNERRLCLNDNRFVLLDELYDILPVTK